MLGGVLPLKHLRVKCDKPVPCDTGLRTVVAKYKSSLQVQQVVGTREFHQQCWGLLWTLPSASDKVAFSRKQTLLEWTSFNGPKGEEAGVLSPGPSRIWTKDYMVRMLNWAIPCGHGIWIAFPNSSPQCGLESLFTHCNLFKCLPCTRLCGHEVGGGELDPCSQSVLGPREWDAHTPGGGESTPPLRNEEKNKALGWIIICLIFLTFFFFVCL